MSLAAESTLMFAEAADAGRIVQIQRDANRDRLAALVAQLRARPPRAVLTCARGSSDHAATFAKYLIETRLGLMVASAAPSVSSVYGGNPAFDNMVCLALSQSGSSPDVLATVAAARAADALTVALVNTISSPLAALVDRVLPLYAGPEISVAATKSYIATLAAVLDLVATWSDDPQLKLALDAAPEMLVAAWQLDWSPMVERLQSARGLFVLGRGPGLGIAQEAALKFKETCGLHAEAFSVAEVRHGPMAMIGGDFPVLVFRQSDESDAGTEKLIEELVARGGDVLVAGGNSAGGICLPGIDAHPAIEPMLRIQSFYRAVNALSVVRGFDPDRPPHLAKVTETV